MYLTNMCVKIMNKNNLTEKIIDFKYFVLGCMFECFLKLIRSIQFGKNDLYVKLCIGIKIQSNIHAYYL